MNRNKDAKQALRARIPENVNTDAVKREMWLAGADAAVDLTVEEPRRASIQRLDDAEGSHWQLVVDSQIVSTHTTEQAAQNRANRFGGALPWGSE